VTSSNSKNPEEPWVKIKPTAYYKMLVHVLRFGSRVRDQSDYKEVMGILIGHLEGDGEIKNVIIDDAVPISHGGAIEVRFKPQDYAKFSTIDEQLANKNQFSVGWYHSHPNLGIFFSGTDVVNQLGWQTQWNPSGIGIVFDHTYLENQNDLGFRTFRLDDPSKGQSSGYHEVDTIVEPPTSTKFYNKIINLINSIHTKEPPILERNEELDLLGAVKFPDEDQLIPKGSELNSEVLLSSIKEGIFTLIENLTQPIITSFNDWSNMLMQETGTLNISMKNNLIEIKDKINSEMSQIQDYVKNSIASRLNKLDDGIYVKLESLISKYREVENQINEFKDKIGKSTEQTINKLLEDNSAKYTDFTGSLKEILENTETLNKKILDIIDLQSEELNSLNNTINEAQEKSLTQLSEYQEHEKETFLNDIKPIDNQMNEIKGQVADFRGQLDNSIRLFKEHKTQIQEELKKLRDKENALKDQLNKEKETKLQLQEELHEIKEVKVKLQNNLNEVKEDKIKLQNELNKINEEKIDIQNSLSRIQEEKEEMKKHIESLEQERDELSNKLNEINKEED
jgi:proteasome lid subunit RPN8/RPN11